MIKYKTIWRDTIEAVEVDRETDNSVFINGNRQAKITSV